MIAPPSSVDIRWKPDELANVNRDLADLPSLEWIRPGGGARGRNCGYWRNYLCPGGGELLSARARCGRRDCPTCAPDWILETSMKIRARFLDAFLLLVPDISATTMVRELPRTVAELKAQRNEVIAAAKATGIVGGALLPTVSQANRKITYCILSRGGSEKLIGETDLADLLGDSIFPKGSRAHAVIWFGNMSYRKMGGRQKSSESNTLPQSKKPEDASQAEQEAAGGEYLDRLWCAEHSCWASYVSTTRQALGKGVDIDPNTQPGKG